MKALGSTWTLTQRKAEAREKPLPVLQAGAPRNQALSMYLWQRRHNTVAGLTPAPPGTVPKSGHLYENVKAKPSSWRPWTFPPLVQLWALHQEIRTHLTKRP